MSKSAPVASLDDNYVAKLLAQDAKDLSSSRSRVFGYDGPLPKRSLLQAPKTNTRFLKTIILSTDQHNSALKVKEEADARQRLRALHRSRQRGDRSGSDCEEWRRLDSDGAIKPKRRKTHADDCGSTMDKEGGRKSTGSSRYKSDRDEGRRYERRDRSHPRHRRVSRSRSPSRHQSRDSHRDRDRHAGRRERARSRSPRRRPNRQLPDLPKSSLQTRSENEQAYDSDPLDAIIGPEPATNPQPRGRGKASAMDGHFSTSYDPSADVSIDVEDQGQDDWEQALEAVHDRQRWQRLGAERLRAAGFSEEQIVRWAKGKELRGDKEEDVRWNKRGEGREWDRGKVVGRSGDPSIESAWRPGKTTVNFMDLESERLSRPIFSGE